MERAVYNALFAAQSVDGRRIRYFSALEGPRVYWDKDDLSRTSCVRRDLRIYGRAFV